MNTNYIIRKNNFENRNSFYVLRENSGNPSGYYKLNPYIKKNGIKISRQGNRKKSSAHNSNWM